VNEKPNVGSPFFVYVWNFLLTASLGIRRLSMYISIFTVAIPVNYTNEFREILKPLRNSTNNVRAFLHSFDMVR